MEYLLGIQSEEGQEFTYLANMGAYEKSLILFKGPFTQRGHQQTLATIELRLGGSAGSYDRLYVLFDCPQQPEFICSAFSGQPQGQPLDLNGDGLLELVTEAGQTWMGECHDELEVITWKGGKAEVIYETFSGQHVNCGGIWAVDNTNIGDTIGTHYRSQFSDEDQDGVFEILQIREVMLSQGGATEEEMGQLAEVVVDSLVLSWQRDGWR